MNALAALAHVGHRVEVATYGSPPENVSVECVDCYEVIADADIGREPWGPGRLTYEDELGAFVGQPYTEDLRP